jgi:ArsR family transcriptional regulator, arsenate/arsenite/antimonite-responsive transcriptional repressor
MYDADMARIPAATVADTQCCARPLAGRIDATEADDLARAFAAIADPVRIRLVSLVAEAGECCACDLLAPLGKSQPTISHHTKVLAEAGILRGEKRGRWVWWSVDRERVDALRDALR